MPKINVYLPDELALAVREARVPVSAICQAALERAVRDVAALRATDHVLPAGHPAHGAIERFTPRARRVLVLAEEHALELGVNEVGTEHVLAGLVTEGDNLAIVALRSLQVDPEALRSELLATTPAPTPLRGPLPLSTLAKNALEVAVTESLGMLHTYIGCEHLLLGLLATDDGLASAALRRRGVERVSARRAIITALARYLQTNTDTTTRLLGDSEDSGALQVILRRLDDIDSRLRALDPSPIDRPVR